MSSTVNGLDVRQDGSMLTARIDRPNGNLLTMDMCRELVGILDDPPKDAHVLVLEGAGNSFCLGRERTGSTPADLPAEVRTLISVNEALSRTQLVTIAKVHGDAAGFGVGLAALCDIAVAREDAAFSFPEVSIELAPVLVLAWLGRLVGRRKAFWLTASGAKISAAEAVEIGLLNQSVSDQPALEKAVDHYVSTLTARSPRVHAEIRSMLRSVAALSEDQANDLAADRLVLGSLRRLRT